MFLDVIVELQPKDILSMNVGCFTRLALNDVKEGRVLIFTGRLFHVILAR